MLPTGGLVRESPEETEGRVAVYGGHDAIRLVLYIEHPQMLNPEVTLVFKVIGIERQRCQLGYTWQCESAGSVYPEPTPVPELKRNSASSGHRSSQLTARAADH